MVNFPNILIQEVWDSPFCILRGCRSKFQQNDAFLSLKIVFISAHRAEPDEMPPYAAFHLGLHCLPKYLFTRIRISKLA